jgi:hypothetical protein
MSDEIALAASYGPQAMADEDVCRAVGEDLTHYFPGHLWCVGCNHEAGTLYIDLPYQKPAHLRHYGFLMHISTVLGADGRKKVMRAGGELLERFGLPRSGAKQEAAEMAAEHGLIADGARDKSKH